MTHPWYKEESMFASTSTSRRRWLTAGLVVMTILAISLFASYVWAQSSPDQKQNGVTVPAAAVTKSEDRALKLTGMSLQGTFPPPVVVPVVPAGPVATCANGELKIHVPANEMIPRINDYLNKHAAGFVMQSETRTAFVDNFRASLRAGAITIRFDYKIRERGWTNGPFGSKLLGPWITDTGWVEADVKAVVENGMLRTKAHRDDVHWGSKNWFTALLRDLFDDHLRDHLATGVSEAVAAGLGTGKELKLEPLFIAHGTPQLVACYGIKAPQAQAWLTQNVCKLKVHAAVEKDGLDAAVPLNLGIYVTNQHSSPIKLAVRCTDLTGKTATQGWFHLQPGEATFLTSQNKRLLTLNPGVFVYAEGEGLSSEHWQGEHGHHHEGQTLPMRAQTLLLGEDGRYLLNIK